MHWGGLCSEPGKGPGSISPGRIWLSLLPDPAGSCEEVVNAKEDEKHMGKMEVRRPYSKQKRKHINRGEWSSSLHHRTVSGHCISPLMVLSILALCSSLTPFLSCFMSFCCHLTRIAL